MLTLRRLRVLVLHLPPDSATVRLDDPNPHWGPAEVLLAHVWQAAARSKKPHPMLAAEMNRTRVKRDQHTAEQARKFRDARRRSRERRAAIERGEIT